MIRWDGESNKGVHERCSMEMCAIGVKSGVVEWFKKEYSDHTEQMERKVLVKRVHMSNIWGPNRRGMPLGK